MSRYWWLVARTDDRPVLIFGSARSEEDARQKGFEMLGGQDFDIKCFPTRDLHTASAMYRGKRLEHGEGLMTSMQRQIHEKGLRQRQERRQRRGHRD